MVTNSRDVAIAKIDNLLNRNIAVEITPYKNTRTNQQNKSLHLYFTFIANELNDLGIEYQYKSIRGKTFEMRYTTNLVKEFIWRPIQRALFKIDSTTKLNTQQMNEIIDVITNFFADKGIVLEFPSIDSLINK